MSFHLGILLALACALATNLGFLLKHRGACAAPLVDARHLVRSARALMASRWFAIGWLVALGAFALHVAALALAPMSVVQAILSAGRRAVRSVGHRDQGHHRPGGRVRPGWAGVAVAGPGRPHRLLRLGPQSSRRRSGAGDRHHGNRSHRVEHHGRHVVFGDPLPGDTLGLVTQVLAFAVICVATALTPAPVRVTQTRTA